MRFSTAALKAEPHLHFLTLHRPQDDAMFDPLHHFVYRLHLHVVHALSSYADRDRKELYPRRAGRSEAAFGLISWIMNIGRTGGVQVDLQRSRSSEEVKST